MLRHMKTKRTASVPESRRVGGLRMGEEVRGWGGSVGAGWRWRWWRGLDKVVCIHNNLKKHSEMEEEEPCRLRNTQRLWQNCLLVTLQEENKDNKSIPMSLVDKCCHGNTLLNTMLSRVYLLSRTWCQCVQPFWFFGVFPSSQTRVLWLILWSKYILQH